MVFLSSWKLKQRLNHILNRLKMGLNSAHVGWSEPFVLVTCLSAVRVQLPEIHINGPDLLVATDCANPIRVHFVMLTRLRKKCLDQVHGDIEKYRDRPIRCGRQS